MKRVLQCWDKHIFPLFSWCFTKCHIVFSGREVSLGLCVAGEHNVTESTTNFLDCLGSGLHEGVGHYSR